MDGTGTGTGTEAGAEIGRWVRLRARLVGGAALVGAVIGALGMAAVALWTGDVRAGESTGFALGALALGCGVLGWAGSVLVGRGVEAARRHAVTTTDWTERDSRRAMARIAGFGAGVMVGVSLVAAAL